MNKLALIFENSWTEALGWTLLHSLWLGALLCLLWRLSLVGKRSPEWRYLSSLITLASLFALIIITFGWELNQLNALQKLELEFAPTQLTSSPNSIEANPRLTEESILLSNLEAWIKPYFPWLSLAWLAGIFLLSLRLIGGWLYLEYLRRSGQQHVVPLQWQQQVEQLSLKMNIKRHVRLLESRLLDHPITMGFFKPIILFPIGIISHMSPAQIEAILLHELAHIKRADYLVNYFQSIVEIVLFYHPAVWWISQDLRESREHCCDDLALSQGYDRWQYAQALLQLTKTNISSKTIFAMSLTGNKHSQLSRRIQRLFGRYTPDRFMSRGLLMALLLSASLMTWAFHNAPTIPVPTAEITMTQSLGEKLLFTITPATSVQEAEKFNYVLRKYGYELETIVRDEAKQIHTIIIAKTTPDGYPITISELKSLAVYETDDTDEPLKFKVDGVISVAFEAGESLKANTIGESSPEENTFTLHENSAVESPIEVEGRPIEGIIVEGKATDEEIHFGPKSEKTESSTGMSKLEKKDPLFVINGELFEQLPPAEIKALIGEKIDPNEIESINVLGGKAAVEVWGPKAEHGVVEILLKNPATVEKLKSLFETETPSPSPLILLNGKPIAEYPISKNSLFVESDSQVPSLLPSIADDVMTINVYKSEKATQLFGEEAGVGVIDITMKESAVNDLLAKPQVKLEQSAALQIYPNPTTDQLFIAFELPQGTDTKIWVSDLQGREVLGVFDLPLAQGPHEIEFDTKQLSSGTYIVNVQYDDQILQRKLVIK